MNNVRNLSLLMVGMTGLALSSVTSSGCIETPFCEYYPEKCANETGDTGGNGDSTETGDGDGDLGDGDGDPGDGDGDSGDGDGDDSFCGDGIKAPWEPCDLGEDNSDNGACTEVCELAECGDGYLWQGMEQCDDGNDNNGDGCSISCELEDEPQDPECPFYMELSDVHLDCSISDGSCFAGYPEPYTLKWHMEVQPEGFFQAALYYALLKFYSGEAFQVECMVPDWGIYDCEMPLMAPDAPGMQSPLLLSGLVGECIYGQVEVPMNFGPMPDPGDGKLLEIGG